MFTQIGEAKELLSLEQKEITVLGIFAVVIVGLIYGSIYFLKKYNKAMEARLEDHKEFNKVLVDVNEEHNDLANKVLLALEVLKNIIHVNR